MHALLHFGQRTERCGGRREERRKNEFSVADLAAVAHSLFSARSRPRRLCSRSLVLQRLYGFGIFFGIGCILTVISAFMTPGLVSGHPEQFAIPYALGAICSLCSTMFLMGPWKQIKSMFEKKRVIATTVYLLSIVFTLVMALVVGMVVLVLLAIVIQALALFWYSISSVHTTHSSRSAGLQQQQLTHSALLSPAPLALSYIPYARTAICNCCKGMVSV